jgi:hypothetical protein
MYLVNFNNFEKGRISPSGAMAAQPICNRPGSGSNPLSGSGAETGGVGERLIPTDCKSVA